MTEAGKGRAGILAAGNWIVDHVKVIDAYPEQDALVFISEEERSNGGGPYNLLVDLRRLGADFPLAGAGLVGEDAYGQWILEDCARQRIDVSRLHQTGAAPTSYTDVMTVGDSGRRTFFHQVGTNALLDDDDVDLEGCPARFFYLGYLLLLETLDRIDAGGTSGAARLLRRAGESGLETIVDLVSAQTGDFRGVVTPSLPFTDTLFLNEFEAGALLGENLAADDAGALMSAATRVLDLGVRVRVIVHSEHGAVAVCADGERVAQGSVRMPPAEIRGTAGAGDAFAAGVVLGLHENRPLADCLREGVCSAASCITDATTSGGVRPLGETLALGESRGFRAFG